MAEQKTGEGIPHTKTGVGYEFHQASSNHGAGYVSAGGPKRAHALPAPGALGAGIPGQFITLALEPKSCHQKKT